MAERRTIRHHRIAAGLTQRGLAARLRVSPMAVSYWETGRREPSARQLRALAGVFGVPMEGIAFEKEIAQAEARPPLERGMSRERRERLIAEIRKTSMARGR